VTDAMTIIHDSWRLERETTAVEWLVHVWAETTLNSSLLNQVRTYTWYDLIEYNDQSGTRQKTNRTIGNIHHHNPQERIRHDIPQ